MVDTSQNYYCKITIPLTLILGISIIMVVSVHSDVQCKYPILITQGTLRIVRKHEIYTGLFTHVFEGENKGEIEGT